jgi:hypothetical protein
MLHLPLLIVSNIAKKAAMTTANLAGKAARVATTTAEKAARIQVRAAQKAASKAHLHAMRSLPQKPTVRLVKEVRSGRTSMSFYRKFDHGSGRVSDFWTLNRDTGRGRIRVASGPMSEFKNLREVVDRSFGREAPRRPIPQTQQVQKTQQVPQARRQAARTQGAGRVAEADRRGREARGRERRLPSERDDTNRRKDQYLVPRTSYSVVFVEGVNRDGTARTRVAKSFESLRQAKQARKHDKNLFIHRHHGCGLLGRGDVVNLPPNHSPGLASRLKEVRKYSRPHDRGLAVQGRGVGADQGRQRDQSIER